MIQDNKTQDARPESATSWAHLGGTDWFNRSRNPSNPDPDGIDQLVLRSLGKGVSPAWQAPEIQLDDGRTLVLEYT